MTDYAQKIAQELNLKPIHVSNAIALIDEGNTIPFIARYRICADWISARTK